MSIRDLINGWLDERLFAVVPLLASAPVRRTMLVSREVSDLIEGPWPNVRAEKRCQRLRADMEAFVTGDVVSVCLEAFKARDAMFGRLHPASDEVWDLRSREPRPGLRLLGSFAETDVFIAFSCYPRSVEVDFLERQPLLGRTSDEWDAAITETKTEWRKLFHTNKPHGLGGQDVHDYISENVFSV